LQGRVHQGAGLRGTVSGELGSRVRCPGVPYRIRALAADFLALRSDPATPQRERKRMAPRSSTASPCDRPDPTCTSGSAAGRPPARPSRSRHRPGSSAQTRPGTLTELDRLLDDHTDAETADALNTAGHRSGEGKPFTSWIVLELRRSHQLPRAGKSTGSVRHSIPLRVTYAIASHIARRS
jgi:hypothetical protein